MNLRAISLIAVVALSTVVQPGWAQYFLPVAPKTSEMDVRRFQPTALKFDETRKVTRRFYDNDLAFVPASLGKGVTLEEMEKGVLLGKFTSDRVGSFGTSGEGKLRAGTYQIWLTRQNRVWTIIAESDGVVRAATNEVTLHMDREDRGQFFDVIRAHIMLPPYALRDNKGRILLAADEGPGTVHGCNCWTAWTTIDDPNSPGRGTTCWPYTRCSCW